MSFFSMLYQLLIGPLELLYQVLYRLFQEMLRNHGWCIVCLSLAMNFLLLPLYRRADAIQDAEREQEKGMADSVAHIKKTFQGDERFMMLQTYYRQNHYKPFYVLKGFLPLVLEIPFFIAAYHFLSNYGPLSGAEFWLIRDLGAPDRLLPVFGTTLNVLPVLMTLINFISSAIYTKGFPLKDKLQLYGMALLFLVLLYGSPAGLVIYWTMNNLFSLVKNLLIRVRIPALEKRREKRRNAKSGKPAAARPAPDTRLFVCGCVFLAVLTGMLIPSAVIVSSPEEFIHALHYYSPLRHILNASLLSFGLFVIWFGIFFYMFSSRGRRIFTAVIWVMSGVFIVNYMFFGTNLGLLSAELNFEEQLRYSLKDILINLGTLAAVIVLLILILRKKRQAAVWITALLLIASAGMAGYNMIRIETAVSERKATLTESNSRRVHFEMSRNGNNVVLIMLDRSLNRYLPYIFEEYPVLQEQFAGFTYYPNTISFGGYTMFGAPPLYGGYEYTPEAMNQRDTELLSDKHNQALRVLPVLFGSAGYQVTVCDPPYAGYRWIPDLSIFDGDPGVSAYNTESGQFFAGSDEVLDQIWQRNFFCYSILKCSPAVLQPAIYDQGFYCGSSNAASQFGRSYAVLKALPNLTHINDGDGNTCLILTNSTTHEAAVCSIPEDGIEPSFDEEKTACQFDDLEGFGPLLLDTERMQSHYTVNAAALLRIGEWLDYLREMRVYDNTRIIIVADHGANSVANADNLQLQVGGSKLDVMYYNPLLLVKDFGSNEFKVSNEMMSNADVPEMLLRDLVSDPVNPFTENPIREIDKKGKKMLIFQGNDWLLEENEGNYTYQPGYWVSVHDDIFDPGNWERLGEW